ncbi:hypothetical protein [Rhizobium leguminosarum]|uniref:hypothetical protein n=1 Tax=Rhizobium leguminosarum TaxID=384 RepID=UPI00103171D9|nr:hypothetical protein [Rhizobium leguminosarum]TAY66481.1 hypothetical protein ELH82_09900 [Rhizobium leguminosarum]
MVKLAPYFRSYKFEHGLRMLEKGYIAARDSLNEEIERIERDSAAYDLAVVNGADLIAEYDEDGHRLWEQSQVYEAQINDVHSALFEVRKAFAIALYHFWEDSVAGWMQRAGKQTDHDKLARYCASEGYGPSPDLEAVRCLANYLKHGRNSKTDWLAKLWDSNPSFLPQPKGFIFSLSEEALFKVAAAILASGPSPRI